MSSLPSGRPSSPATSPLVADVQLRGSGGVRQARVHWPPRDRGRSVPELVVFLGGDQTGRELAASLDAVVLVSVASERDGGMATLEWAADHGADLGADPERLAVGGEGAGAAIAVAIAQLAGHNGWPVLSRRPLVGSDLAAALDAKSPR